MTSAIIGGYRLVRRLGEGARAEVLLGYPDHEPDAAPVAVKAYRPWVAERSILTEAEALARGEGDHVVRVLDVASDPRGIPALLLERAQRGSLARLLRDRETLQAGEAITALAPIAHALARLHSAGVAHRALRPECVLFDHDGAPVLACFGAATTFDPDLPRAALAADAGVVADAAAFTSIACTVLERVEPDRAVRALLGLREADLEPSELLTVWSEGLFDLARPEPIDMTARSSAPFSVPLRGPVAMPVENTPDDHSSLLAALALPEWLQRMLEPVESRARRLLAHARERTGTVRARVWVPATAVGLAFMGALAFVPPSTATEAPTTMVGPSSAVGDQASAAAPSTVPAPGIAQPAATDDPAAAAVALLAERERCIQERSVLCLDGVGQPGSAALAADQQLVRELQTGGELPEPWRIAADGVVIVERLGDSALVTLGDVAEHEPASLLLMQGEAGWRIRSYLER